MWNFVIGLLTAVLCFFFFVSGIHKQRVEFVLPFINELWNVSRKELPFFYWLGLVVWLLAGLGFLIWGLLSL